MKYAIVTGTNTSGNNPIKVYEVENIRKSPLNPNNYSFDVIKPVYGTYWTFKPGSSHYSEADKVSDSLDEIKFMTKKMVIEETFKGSTIDKIPQLIKSMNKAK